VSGPEGAALVPAQDGGVVGVGHRIEQPPRLAGARAGGHPDELAGLGPFGTPPPTAASVVRGAAFVVKLGDNLPSIADVVADAAGPVAVAGATVRLKLWAWDRSVVALDVAALNLDDGTLANRGAVRYDWASGDTATLGAGWFRGEWEVTFAGGAVLTSPQDGQFVVAVAEDVR
jgi:hypothetical protein